MMRRKLTAGFIGFALLTGFLFPFFPAYAAADVTLVFGGDVMLSRNVGQQIEKRGGNNGSWVTSKIAREFKSANLAFVNLEAPFAPGPAVTSGMTFRANPNYITALTSAGIDVVSLANNHARNQGALGITTTIDLLKKNKIAFAGAGKTGITAYDPALLAAGPYRIALLAYTYNEANSNITAKSPTIAKMDVSQMKTNIHFAKKKAHLVIVSMHAGTEYTRTPTGAQIAFARAAIDAGADMVIGHHPHWAQTTEVYKGKPILYSLGNLVFDQQWSKETQIGVVAKAIVRDGKISAIQLKPIKIDYNAQPRWMNPAEAAPVLKAIGRPSGIIRL